MNEKQQRDFKGVWIPREIWLDPELNPIEKCLLVEIDSLDNDPEKGCFASNEYLAEFIQRKPNTTANIVSSLRKRGYIYDVFWDGRNRGIRVKLSRENEGSLHEIVKADFTKSGELPSRNREHNNTVINTDSTLSESEPKNEPNQQWESEGESRFDIAYKEATAHLKAHPQLWKSICNMARIKITTKQQFNEELTSWLRHHQDDYDITKNVVKRLTGGKSSFAYSWLRHQWRIDKYNGKPDQKGSFSRPEESTVYDGDASITKRSAKLKRAE